MAGFHNQLEEAKDQNKKQKQGIKKNLERNLILLQTKYFEDMVLSLSVKWVPGKVSKKVWEDHSG